MLVSVIEDYKINLISEMDRDKSESGSAIKQHEVVDVARGWNIKFALKRKGMQMCSGYANHRISL